MAREHEPFISIVIPTYNEAGNTERFYPKLTELLEAQDWRYELVYVDDGSTDGSTAAIAALMQHDKRVRRVTLSRNFGKEAALTAGIHAAKGDAIITIDADGQYPMELIPEFVAKWQAGAEVVTGVRTRNQDEGFVKRYGSKVFYKMLNPMATGTVVPGATDFRLIDREVAEAFKKLTERNRIVRGLIEWLGFRQAYIEFVANPRLEGAPTYTYRKLVRLALHTFVSQSTRPLFFTGVLGMIVVGVSFVLGLFMVVERFLLHDPLHLGISGTAILAVFLSFLIGIVLVCQGLLALYIESIHNETQNRPLYVARDED